LRTCLCCCCCCFFSLLGALLLDGRPNWFYKGVGIKWQGPGANQIACLVVWPINHSLTLDGWWGWSR
jgi:hypothetical protein